MVCSKSDSKREIHSDEVQETRKISQNLNYHLKELEKEEGWKQ